MYYKARKKINPIIGLLTDLQHSPDTQGHILLARVWEVLIFFFPSKMYIDLDTFHSIKN